MARPSPGQAPPGQHGTGGALSGLRVLGLTRALPGPHAAAIPGDLGAGVIKAGNARAVTAPAGGAAAPGQGGRVLPLRQQEQARDQRHREDAAVVFAEAGFSQEITAVRGRNGAVT